ncbi:Protein FMP42 [Yarrowia sp. C11]|nr:Protein FMP42 [Yarrowia sp. E02]KAG5373481.1 Protein FMP42 [Yarrowia sp. C11]
MTSSTRRIVQVACAVIWCLFAAGPIFGFAALKPVLVSEGVYSEYCTKSVTGGPCKEQDLRLNFMFNVGAILTNVDAMLVGFVLDKYGPRVSGIVGSVVIFVAALVLSNAALLPGDPWLIGYSLLAVGGPFVFISSFHLSNTFVQYSGTILALLTGAFDASSAVFLGFQISYKNSAITLSQLFTIYTIVPVFILLAEVFIMPQTSYKSDESFASVVSTSAGHMEAEEQALLEDADLTSYTGRRSSFISNRGSFNRRRSSLVHEAPTPQSLAQYGSLKGLTAKQQLATHWAFLIIVFTTIQMLRINYFVATINSQYTYLLGHEKAQQINAVFDYLLPLGGVLAIPMIGFVLDHMSLVGSWTTVVTLSLTMGVLNLIARPWAAYLNVLLFVLYRPLYYTAVSDYAAKIFGFKTFGTVYGVVICIAGLFNILQSVLDRLTKKTFHLNPTPINGILVGATAIAGLALVGYIKSQGQNLKRQFLEIEAEASEPMLMPGAAPVPGVTTTHDPLHGETEISFNDPNQTKKAAKKDGDDCGSGHCKNCVCDV